MQTIPFSLFDSPKASACFPQEIPAYVGVGFSDMGTVFEAETAKVIRLRFNNRAQMQAASKLAVSLNHMVAHLNEPMNISTLSAMAGVSMSRFFELFKSATNDSPLNWLIRARMRWAGELLEQSDMRIKEIAARIGYDDQFYFSRLFKIVHGVSPSDYRRRKDAASAVLQTVQMPSYSWVIHSSANK